LPRPKKSERVFSSSSPPLGRGSVDGYADFIPMQSGQMTNRSEKYSARLLLAVRLRQASQGLAGGLASCQGRIHDLKRSHYNCVWNLTNEIASRALTALSARLAMTTPSVVARLALASRSNLRDFRAPLAMIKSGGPVMTRSGWDKSHPYERLELSKIDRNLVKALTRRGVLIYSIQQLPTR